MDQITISVLLDYLYNKFAITFVFSLVGITVKELMRSVSKKRKINIKTNIASSVFTTILMCAASEWFDIDSISVYGAVCMICGIWGDKLLKLANNSRFMTRFLANLAKRGVGGAKIIGRAFTDTLAEEGAKKKESTKKEKDSTLTEKEDESIDDG